MLVELAIYGVLTGYLFRVKKLNIFISLPVSMLIGRIGYGMVKLIMVGFKENLISIVSGMIIAGLPGIVLHLILVPLVVKALSNTGYIEEGSAK